MNIAIINPFDPLPGEGQRLYRYSMLANEMIHRGHRVRWISANFHHGAKQYRKQPMVDENLGLQIILAHVPPYKDNISIRRIISHRVYAREVFKALRTLHTSEPIDVVIASIPPTVSARVAMEFCAETGALGVIDMQDPWPRVIESLFPKLLRSFLSLLLLRSFQRDVQIASELASGLVAISPENLDYLVSFRNGKPQIPHASFNLGLDNQVIHFPERVQKNADDPLTVAYIGNFGYMNDLETVVRAAAICVKRNIKFVLIGDGPIYSSVRGISERLGLTNVDFLGRIPFESAIPILSQSDLGLVAHTANFPPNTVNKIFDYLCLGLPVVSSLRGIFQKDLAKFNLGLQYEAGNAESLANAICHLDKNRDILHEMAKEGLEYARKNMDGKTTYKQYVDFIEDRVFSPFQETS
jgi:glycosyltransferase involved in cell wall biosynthesis